MIHLVTRLAWRVIIVTFFVLSIPYLLFFLIKKVTKKSRQNPALRDSARFAVAHAQVPELLVTVYMRDSYVLFTCYLTSFVQLLSIDDALYGEYCRRCIFRFQFLAMQSS